MADTAPGPGPAALPWTQTACMVVGGLLIVFGVFGFAVTGFGEILERDTGATLFGLELNPLQNLMNVIFGLAGMASATTQRRARVFGLLLAAAYGSLGVFGLVTLAAPGIDVFSLNLAAACVYLVAGVATGLAIAFGPVRAEDVHPPQRQRRAPAR